MTDFDEDCLIFLLTKTSAVRFLRSWLSSHEIKHHSTLMSLSSLFPQFSKETLANMYSAYIDNFLNAKDAVRIAKEAKPAFHKFLEVSFGLKHGTSGPVWVTAFICLFGKQEARLEMFPCLVGSFLKPETHHRNKYNFLRWRFCH